jgi:DNA-directed RNA polymerase specialized sigma24 family protein
MSDSELIDSIMKNEEDAAFCLFHHRLKKFFESQACTYSKLQYSANDVANEMYIHLSNNNWERLRSFKFKSSLFAWITVVTNRYLLNRIINTSASIKDVLFSYPIEQGDKGKYDPPENIPDPNQIFTEESRDDSDFFMNKKGEI